MGRGEVQEERRDGEGGSERVRGEVGRGMGRSL